MVEEKNIEVIQLAFDHCPIGACIYDADSDLIYVNEAFLKLTKTELRNVEKDKYKTLVHPNDRENVDRRWKAAKETSPFHFDMTYRLSLSDESALWVNVKSNILYQNGVIIGYLDMFQDQTEEKNYEERIITEIMESEDLERRRFANELHDGLGENLTAAFLNLETIRETMNGLDKDTRDKFNKGVSFINEAITETRSIAHNIMPKAIDDFGFVITVEGMIEGLREVTDIEFTVYHNLEDNRINSTVELNLYRITQEVLNNVLKHSKAKLATIQLLNYKDHVILTIEDDGRGFNLNELGQNLTDFGISSMRNRANSISASMNIDSHINKGTTITIEAPLE